MVDETNQNSDSQQDVNDDTQPDPSTQDSDIVERLVKQRVDEALKPIKEKLDNAYALRDEALQRAARYEKEKQDAEIARLREEGKHREAFEKEIAQERAKSESLLQENVKLTRDIELRNVLSSHDFRNDSAREMAYREIVGQLVKNEQGVWTHKSGVSIKDYVKDFVGLEDNGFLLKPKVSSGSGSGSPTGTPDVSNKGKSLFDLTQEEVLKLAREGKLPRKT